MRDGGRRSGGGHTRVKEREGFVDRPPDEREEPITLQKTDLPFGRMDIDIKFFRGKVEVDPRSDMNIPGEPSPRPLGDRLKESGMPDPAPVDEEVLGLSVLPDPVRAKEVNLDTPVIPPEFVNGQILLGESGVEIKKAKIG